MSTFNPYAGINSPLPPAGVGAIESYISEADSLEYALRSVNRREGNVSQKEMKTLKQFTKRVEKIYTLAMPSAKSQEKAVLEEIKMKLQKLQAKEEVEIKQPGHFLQLAVMEKDKPGALEYFTNLHLKTQKTAFKFISNHLPSPNKGQMVNGRKGYIHDSLIHLSKNFIYCLNLTANNGTPLYQILKNTEYAILTEKPAAKATRIHSSTGSHSSTTATITPSHKPAKHAAPTTTNPTAKKNDPTTIQAISSQTSSELNETVNILLLSQAWQKTGKIDLKRKGESKSVQIDLDRRAATAEINCEIMSTTWKEFCLNHPRDVPKDFQDLVGDALRYAAKDSDLEAAGYFERYKNDLPVIFPIFIGSFDEYGYVGCLIRKNYFCIFNGNEGPSIFHGKFQTDLMTEVFLKDLRSPRQTMKEYQELVGSLKDRLNFESNKHHEVFLNHIVDYFNKCQPSCHSSYNLQRLVPILLTRHMYDKIDMSKSNAIRVEEIYKALKTVQNISHEWELFQRAWLLRNYLCSETRQEYELCHDFVKSILKDSWGLWLGNERSQATKNILYQCEKRYLDLLSNEDCCNYKADKVAYLTQVWQRHSLYPFSVSAPKDRLR